MKIDNIAIQNFKFFQDEEVIELNGKNLLIYGENGSGKSSLNWALYTLLQSSFKEDRELQKYFDKNRDENLLNKYKQDTMASNITLKLINDTEYSVGTNKPLEGNALEVQNIFFASDFINYKILHKFHDFKNSEEIDLLDVFVEEVFPYIKDTNDTDFSNYQNWYKNIMAKLPKGYTKKKKPHKKDEDKLKNLNSKINYFIEEINSKVNDSLHNDFKENRLNLKLKFIEGTFFLDEISKTNHYYGITKPKILLVVELLDDNISSENKEIKKPHTFLNEAKLTSIALAIRFTILNLRLAADGILKVLILDDLLLSLDMSKRMQILELLEKKYNKFQIIILTHDRSFFEVVKTKLDDTKWEKKEFYVDNIGNKPFIKSSLNYLEKAEGHYNNHDYPAAANYLRKEIEFNLKDYLNLTDLDKLLDKVRDCIFKEYVSSKMIEENFIHSLNECSTILEELKNENPQEFGQIFGMTNSQKNTLENAYKEYKKYKELEDNMRSMRTIILNPLSHDDLTNGVYRNEIEETIKLIKTFQNKLNFNN